VKETKVPTQYLAVIKSIESIEDPDKKRDTEQRATNRLFTLHHLMSLKGLLTVVVISIFDVLLIDRQATIIAF